jgi:predicted DsbA family dithiol-disulfide isomerase
VVWWPFELHPDTPPEGRSLEAAIARRGSAYGEHLKAYAAEAGVTLGSVRWLSNSHRALELAELARDRGCFEAVHNGLFRAYFEEGQDIGAAPVLERVAAEAGLDPEEVRFESLVGRYSGLIDRCTAIAREKGVQSTPTMIFDDRFVLTGAQDLAVYQDVLRRLGAEPRHPGII